MDMASIQIGFESLKTAKDIIKTLMELKEFAAHQGRLNELSAALVAAYADALEFQSKALTLLAEKGNLEKEIMKLKDWEAEAQRYELKAIATSVFAYALKETMRGVEPAHLLCSQCYQEHIKSILQRSRVSVILQCPACKTEFHLSEPPNHRAIQRYMRGEDS